MLKDSGLAEEELKAAIQELRKGQKVTSQTDENTFDSLNRFAINLNEQARSGEVSPDTLLILDEENEILAFTNR
jgi:ATP-dependent Clp protease ATP-binding subunit ClpB